MLVVQVVGHWNVHFIEPVVPRLVTADEQDRRSPGVEGVEYPDRPAACLHSKLLPPLPKFVRILDLYQLGVMRPYSC